MDKGILLKNIDKLHTTKQDKNWYCEVDNIKITTNSYNYTIITVHTIK